MKLRSRSHFLVPLAIVGCTPALPAPAGSGPVNPALQDTASHAERARSYAAEARAEAARVESLVREIRSLTARVHAAEALCKDASMKAERAAKRKVIVSKKPADAAPAQPAAGDAHAAPTNPQPQHSEYSRSDAPVKNAPTPPQAPPSAPPVSPAHNNAGHGAGGH